NQSTRLTQSSQLPSAALTVKANTLKHNAGYDRKMVSTSFYICFLGVLSKYRKLKLGTYLLNAAIREVANGESQHHDVKDVALNVNVENQRALGLHHKCHMRCINYKKDYYKNSTYQHVDGYYLNLNVKQVINIKKVCFDEQAVRIPTKIQQNDEQCLKQYKSSLKSMYFPAVKEAV
ncbi:unnamed protein product, partial [Didymodactylos carnosus]